ncbi:MAG: ABC transporter ATP-binding protein/permease, partial [Corynebacterium sp.]|nr:ABC transporter ATP-binding protein/permease [Corynebacterium sp.]
DVHFRYGGDQRSGTVSGTGLAGITLSVPDGARVVLVGASGSGKSTLARVISGELRPDQGRMSVGGVDAHRATTASGRPAAVLVTQEVHQFTGTVADNLRLASPTATDAELTEALTAVGVNTDAPLTSADTLDEATVQQLALARVLLADPPVVVLDEATAHAGTGEGAGRLDAAVDTVAAGRTAIIVAHHLSQAQTADLVVVLEDGRVVESGTHTDLVERGGRYSRLWEAWLPAE